MKGWLQAGRYASVAVQAALSDWAMFSLLVVVGADEVLAQGVARVVGGAVSFVANKLWAFRAEGTHTLAREVRRFLALYAFSYVLSLSLFAVSEEALGPWLAKLLADTTCLVVNFLVMRGWVFATRSPTDLAEARDADAEPREQRG